MRSNAHPAVPQGSTPTYFVIPLSGGEHLPAGTSTIFTGQGGSAVGPLDFNASVKAQVDAALANSGLVAVDTPNQNYVRRVSAANESISRRLTTGAVDPQQTAALQTRGSNSTTTTNATRYRSSWAGRFPSASSPRTP